MEDTLLVFFDNKTLAKFIDSNIRWELKLDTSGFDFVMGNNMICAYGLNNHFSIIDLANGEIILMKENLCVYPNQATNNGNILVYNNDKSIISVYDFLKMDVVMNIHPKEYQSNTFDLDFLFCEENIWSDNWQEKDIVLYNYNTKSKKLLWKKNVTKKLDVKESKFLEIVNFIVVRNHLWIAIKTALSHTLLCFDVEDGSFKHHQSDLEIKYAYTVKQIKGSNNLFCIYGFSHEEPETEYKEVDGLTGKIIRSGVVQSLLDQNLVLKDWEKYGDNIYFTAIKEEKFPTHIGVLDYNTLELLHWQKVEMPDGCFLPAGKAPVLNGNRLYVLDTGGTLHIYEREY